MINVLLLGVGGNVSQGILKALRKSDLKLHIVGACVEMCSAGLYMCDTALLAPYANDPMFIDWVIDVCNNYHIDIIFTGVEENIIALAKNIKKLKEKTKSIFVSSTYEQLLIGQNKLKTCEWLKNNGCNYPQYADASDEIAITEMLQKVGYPLIAKPISGKSGKGIILIHDEKQLASVLKTLDSYVLEEYIGTEKDEYTVGCYCDQQGKLVDILVMQRKLKRGTTIYAKVIDDIDIKNEAKKICDKYKPVGPLNIQMRKDKRSTPVCFELNVRFSGSTAMRANFGFHDVEAMIKEYVLGEDIAKCFNVQYGEAFRFDSELYVYDDSVSKMLKEHCVDDLQNRKIVFDNR